jgi:2-oxoglutarate dehydrogenase E2 component (dihydrolipoamide succinyltransferase)
MTVNIVVPALGESVSEAAIAKWHKKEGDQVSVDELIVELETEKVTLEVNAPASGTVSSILKQQGEVVKVGDILSTMEPGEVKVSPQIISSEKHIDLHADLETKSSPVVDSVVVNAAAPSAVKIASESGVNLSSVHGSGKDGRITKGDVLYAIASSAKREERVKMTRLRKTIAQRLKDSQNTAAILTTFNEIDMYNVVQVRKKYKDDFEKKHGIKLGFMSFFVKAVVSALKEIPAVNAEIDGDDIVYKNYYDIGVAVGTEQGLVVPVVRGADQMSFADIEKEISRLGKKAKDNKLGMDDMIGGTFSITNGGVYGSLLSTPIINPPQSAILGMHNMVERPVVIDGKIEIRPMMYVALSYDHRIIDGKEAVTFLVKIKNAIENPERMLLSI